MNLRSVVSLADESITTVDCRPIRRSPREGAPIFTFKCTKALASVLTCGSLVVCETKIGIYVMEVLEAHPESTIDPDSSIEYCWAFQRVDTGHLETLQDSENLAVETLVRHRRIALQTRMRAMADDSSVPMLVDGRSV